MQKKSFDCIKFKRETARRIHEDIKNMTIEQEMAYFRKHSEWLFNRQKAGKEHDDGMDARTPQETRGELGESRVQRGLS